MQNLFRIFVPSPTSHDSSYSYSYSYSYTKEHNSAHAYVSYVLTQLAPLLVLLGVPALALLARAYVHRTRTWDWDWNLAKAVRVVYMVLESLFGVTLPLSWVWGPVGGREGEGREEKRRRRERGRERRKRGTSTGASAGAGVSGDAASEVEEDDKDLYYPGLVNISGTYCFLNSVLQATASLAYLQPYLDAIHARAVDLDVPTPVVDTLQDTIKALNTPKSSRSALRPVPIINALSQPVSGPAGGGSRSKLFASREHQDAQELFQLLSECIKSEAQAVDAEAQRDRGLGAFVFTSSAASSPSASPSPGSSSGYLPLRGSENFSAERERENELSASSVFDGLTANRRSCVACGYTEAVMHFAFATWSLALPSFSGFSLSSSSSSSSSSMASCSLQDCLAEYTRLELLTDCVCRRCSMRATHARLREEAERLAEAVRTKKPAGAGAGVDGGAVGADGTAGPSQYKKKKAREARKLERLVASAIEEGRIEEDLKGVRMERIVSPASTKQAMIARPPKVLVLHLNRSMHFSSYTGPSRNPIRVRFPEILDLTPYTTSGQLSTKPSAPISIPPPPPPVGSGSGSSSGAVPIQRSTTPTQGMYDHPRVLYRLSAVVAHYGAHSFGHYVCFRRKPWVSSASRNDERNDRKGKARGEERRAYPMVPQMPCPYGCECQMCTTYGPVRDFDPSSSSYSSSSSSSPSNSQIHPQPSSTSSSTHSPPHHQTAQNQTHRAIRGPHPPRPGSGRGWLRISDDSVEEVGVEQVLSEGSGAFLLFYERVQSAWVTQRPWTTTPMYSSAAVMDGSSDQVTGVGVGVGEVNGSESLSVEAFPSGVKAGFLGGGMGVGAGGPSGLPIGGRGVNSVYLRTRGTPRSSEETVRPADVHASSSASHSNSASASTSTSTSSSLYSLNLGAKARKDKDRERELSEMLAGVASGSSFLGGNSNVIGGRGSASAGSSLSSSWSGSGGGSLMSELVKPRVVRRTTAGRREKERVRERNRSRSRSRSGSGSRSRSPSESGSGLASREVEVEGKGKGKEKEAQERPAENPQAADRIPNGSAVPPNGTAIPSRLPLPNGSASASASASGAHTFKASDQGAGVGRGGQNENEDEDEIDLELSESIVKVEFELPSPPRSRSSSPTAGTGASPARTPASSRTVSKSSAVGSGLGLEPATPPGSSPVSPSPPPSPTSPTSPRSSGSPAVTTTTAAATSPLTSPSSPKRRRGNKGKAKARARMASPPSSSSSRNGIENRIPNSNSTSNSNSNASGSGNRQTNGDAILVDRPPAASAARVGLRA